MPGNKVYSKYMKIIEIRGANFRTALLKRGIISEEGYKK
jgi:hypothetical protein